MQIQVTIWSQKGEQASGILELLASYRLRPTIENAKTYYRCLELELGGTWTLRSAIAAILSSQSLVNIPTSVFVKSGPLYNMLLRETPRNLAEQSKTILIFPVYREGKCHDEVYTTRHAGHACPQKCWDDRICGQRARASK